MADFKDILIWSEVKKGRITTSVKELISIGKKISQELGQALNLLLIGPDLQPAAQEAACLGADKVYLIKHQIYEELSAEHYLSLMTKALSDLNPYLILLAHTDLGRDMAPRLAASLERGVCLDCIDLAFDSQAKLLLQTKPVYGGKAVAVWASPPQQPQIITLRPRAASPVEADPSGQSELISLEIEADKSSLKSQLLKTVKDEIKGLKLEEAKIIVAGGGGIGGRQGFQLLEELACLLGGAVGITRVPSDEGWMPKSLEIGQTGHIVSPDLYLAVGISGAPQHLAGCSGSKRIVAVNKDPEAHIFKESDWGIVADYREALPVLIDKYKALKESF